MKDNYYFKYLPYVSKPIRYTNSELNIVFKPDSDIYFGLVFPDVYEIGMSNHGIKILYHIINRLDGVACERIFAPWPDLGEKLKKHSLTLCSIETSRPLPQFNILGFSLQSELSYTNVLYLLDLGSIPFYSNERDAKFPLIIAGGPAALNPLPLSPFFDLFVIGDGEEVTKEIIDVYRGWDRKNKQKLLELLSTIEGVWIPAIHHKNKTVRKRTVRELKEDDSPYPPLLPICPVVHDRLVVEVMRGCLWGCRFCQAGFTNRPLRRRDPDEIVKIVDRGVRATGWEEISLLAFSVLDYPNLPGLIARLNERLEAKKIGVSLPSLRGELFNRDIGRLLTSIKRSGLTFAPEAASDSLRCRINKQFSNDELFKAIQAAYDNGWRMIKMYFMIGLAFETNEDVKEIAYLLNTIGQSVKKGIIKASISPFVPKPHTPFENERFASCEEIQEKIVTIRKHLKSRRIKLTFRDPESAGIEAILSRGDEKMAAAINRVYRDGGRFEEWREGFDLKRWQKAFNEEGIDMKNIHTDSFARRWSFIDIGIKKDFLIAEYKNAEAGKVTKSCLYDTCCDCGSCDNGTKKNDAPDRGRSS